MKETILKDYLENKVTIDVLATDLKDSQKRTSYDVISVHVDTINETDKFR